LPGGHEAVKITESSCHQTDEGVFGMRIRLSARVLLTAVVLVAAGGCVPTDGTAGSVSPTPSPGTGGSGETSLQLAELVVAAPGTMAGYSRDKFGNGWTSQGNSCDTREIVLQQQGKDVKSGKDCKPVSGTWVSLYDGKTVTNPGELDIDHLVPEAEAWRTGAAQWSQENRERFANDYSDGELVAVTAHSNRSKGDDAPPDYLPVQEQWCNYATGWVRVKHVFELTISERERDALKQMLGTC
jgi:hypothetical protein